MQRLSQQFALPDDALQSRKPRIILSGRRQVSIENHSGLMEYTTSCIRVRAGHSEVAVEGEGLMLSIMDRSVIEITGHIAAVRLS